MSKKIENAKIVCKSCKTKNPDFAIKCEKCGSFLPYKGIGDLLGKYAARHYIFYNEFRRIYERTFVIKEKVVGTGIISILYSAEKIKQKLQPAIANYFTVTIFVPDEALDLLIKMYQRVRQNYEEMDTPSSASYISNKIQGHLLPGSDEMEFVFRKLGSDELADGLSETSQIIDNTVNRLWRKFPTSIKKFFDTNAEPFDLKHDRDMVVIIIDAILLYLKKRADAIQKNK